MNQIKTVPEGRTILSDEESSPEQDVQPIDDLKNKIFKYEYHEEELKGYFKQMNHVLSQPNEYPQHTIFSLLAKERAEYVEVQKAYLLISPQHQRPYHETVYKYSCTIEQHAVLISLLPDQQRYLAEMERSRVIDINILHEYLETVSWRHYLRGALGVVGAFFLQSICGASNRWNMLNLYATDYYGLVDDGSFVVKNNSYAAPLAVLLTGLGMRTGIHIAKAIGHTSTCLLAVVVASLSLFLSSYMPSMPLFVLFNTVVYTFFACFVFLEGTAQCVMYFPKSRVFLNSIILTGLVGGQFLFGMLNETCMNPKGDLTRDFVKQMSLDLPFCMQEMSVIVLLLGLVSVACIYPLFQDNKERQAKVRKIGPKRDFENECASEGEAVNSRVFWVMMGGILLTMCSSFFLLTNYRSQVSPYVNDEGYVNQVVLVFLLANAFCRVPVGLMFTKIGFKASFALLSALNATLFAVIQFALPYPDLYLAVYAFGGVCFGGFMVLFFNLNINVFGDYVGEQIAGYLWVGYAFANFTQFLLVDLMDVTSGFGVVTNIWTCTNLVSLVLVSTSRLQGPWENSVAQLEWPWNKQQ